ncbi:SIT4 phosphatase-associated protein-domain-containing protein [Cunninghamella echinulata]|nr:SIT4 phosphatase-associated protein-domain-containing protein [Cunninghamella echinulata]
MEDCLSQVQLRHRKLIDYMSQPLTLSQIIRYLVLGEKYAFLCSEIISSAIPSILETMVFDNKELLMVYWTLLYQEYRLTAPQINYFVKINQVLLNRRPGDMIRFIMTHLSDDLLAHWLYHFGDDQGCQLAELLVSLIQCELLSEGSGIVNWLHEKGLVHLLVNQLHPSNDSMVHQFSQQVLCDIIRLSQSSHRDIISMGKNGLINDFTSTEVMTSLIDYMLDSKSDNSVDTFICGAKLIVNLIRYNDERYLNDKDNDDTITLNPIEEPGENETPQNSKILSTMLTICTSRLGEFLSLLENPRSKVN